MCGRHGGWDGARMRNATESKLWRERVEASRPVLPRWRGREGFHDHISHEVPPSIIRRVGPI